jgi:CRP/FNR family transcriptional regulator, dissimilatory nitrate respiration regulator
MLPKERNGAILEKLWIKEIAKAPLFEGISESELESLLGCMAPRIRHFGKGENIALAGEPLEGIGILLRGSAAITRDTPGGSRAVIAMLLPGELFGETAAYAGAREWPASVDAVQDATAAFISPASVTDACAKACSGHRAIQRNMLRILSQKAQTLMRKTDYLSLPTLREKISAYLLEQQAKTGKKIFMMDLNRNELADFLNVSRPSLSREMGKMREEGLIEYQKSALRITDPDSLRRAMQQGGRRERRSKAQEEGIY